MSNIFKHTESILVHEGNIKRALKSHFNYWWSKVNDDGKRDRTCLCTTKINFPKPKTHLPETFKFKAIITWFDMVNNKQIMQKKIIGTGKCLPPTIKYYRNNFLVENWVLIEWDI